eukprot:9264199-Lingulodinium_polyedra.AAC.1
MSSSQPSQDAFDDLPDGSDVDEPVLSEKPAPQMPQMPSEDRSFASRNSCNCVRCAPICFDALGAFKGNTRRPTQAR